MVVAHVLVTIAEVEKEGKISQIVTQETEDSCPSVRSVGRKKSVRGKQGLGRPRYNHKTEKPQLHAEASVMRVATTYFPTTLVQYHRRCGA